MTEIEKELRRYTPLIYVEGKVAGCGMFVGDILITDAHIISPCLAHYVEFDGRRIFLNRKNQLYIREDIKVTDGYDLAVYQMEHINSPFVLADELPSKGEVLTIPYYNVQDSTFSITSATVDEKREGNYFGVNTSTILTVGNSGSPIVKEDKVYGLLNAGDFGKPFCVFLSAKSIRNVLRTTTHVLGNG
jgi:hypothetical protein